MASPGSAPTPRLTAPIVLIEDDPSVRESLAEYLEGKGYTVTQAARGEDGIAHVDADTEVVIADFKLPGMSGIEVLREVRRKNPSCEVIIATGHGSIDSAVEAMKEGAYHYVTKPINPTVLLRILGELVQRRSLEAEVSQLRQQLDSQYGFENLVGRAPPMRRVFDVIRQVAPTRTTVLIHGESGTGKELVARAVHAASPRRDRPFVAVNLGAVPRELLESTLFGHERGAFTGAVQRRGGLLQAANGGTLFIDEVGELEPSLQVKLLRVLESRTVTPLGSTREEPVDLRIVAATHQDLEKRMQEGKFREDFLYRLKVVTLELPPLRDRREDIPLLARTFLEQAVKENGLAPRRFTPEALSRLTSFHWPGNVRELRNVVESAAVMSTDESVGIDDLPAPLVERSPAGVGGLFHVGQTMGALEQAAILSTLKANGGNRTKTADTLQISLRTLQRKLKEYQVQE